MFFKVSALHVYSHHDDAADKIENCKICDAAIRNQHAEHDFSPSVSLEIPIINKIEIVPLLKNPQVFTSSSEIDFSLFGRPPPASV